MVDEPQLAEMLFASAIIRPVNQSKSDRVLRSPVISVCDVPSTTSRILTLLLW